MLKTIVLSSLLAWQAYGQAQQYVQCGGQGFSGSKTCVSGSKCQVQNQYYSQCIPDGSGAVLYGQCGGQGYTGPRSCPPNSKCQATNQYHSQCVPSGPDSNPVPAKGTGQGTGTTTPVPKAPASTGGGTVKGGKDDTPATTPPKSGPVKVTPVGGKSGGSVSYAGVNIAGCDFGCTTDGSCTSGGSCPKDGKAQMAHFASVDGFNIFRLPVGWQYLVNNKLGGTIGGSVAEAYFQLVSDCLATGPQIRCVIDIHNYARWNGAIIGQGGPKDADFINLWEQLATKYAKEERVVFGIMNEPHEVDIGKWANTVQGVVSCIRAAGAKTQMILIPGNGYTGAAAWPTQSGPTMSKVNNGPGDSSHTGLIFDAHQYFDSDSSGTSTSCVSDKIAESFSPLAAYLKSSGRQAMISEFGGGNNAGCVDKIGKALAFFDDNAAQFVGWTSWAAGGFDSSYELAETPQGGTDTMLVAQALRPAAKGSASRKRDSVVLRRHQREWSI